VVRSRTNTGYSNYHALQTEFRANNLFKQLTIRSSYTFSKTLDNVSEIFSTVGGGNTVFFAQNPANQVNGKGEYSFSGLDYPHQWSMTFIEQLPFFKEQHGVVGHVLGGWAVSATTSLLPVSAINLFRVQPSLPQRRMGTTMTSAISRTLPDLIRPSVPWQLKGTFNSSRHLRWRCLQPFCGKLG